MPTDSHDRRLSFVLLCLTPFLVFGIAAVRALRVPGLYHALAGVQLTVVCMAMWRLGGWAIASQAMERRKIATAGTLLVAPWVLFSLIPGIGLPQQATEAENQLRYGVLLLDGLVMAGGLLVVGDALRDAGERFYSSLGSAAAMLAGPLVLIWAMFPLALGGAAMQERSASGQLPLWLSSLQGLSEMLLMSAVFLTYLAATAFAAAFGRTRWLGPASSRSFVWVSLFAVLCLAITTTVAIRSQDPMAIFKTWYAIPGFVFSIPAVSFMIPSLLGVTLLRRAGDAAFSAAAGPSVEA